jgi:hypothetical protein
MAATIRPQLVDHAAGEIYDRVRSQKVRTRHHGHMLVAFVATQQGWLKKVKKLQHYKLKKFEI